MFNSSQGSATANDQTSGGSPQDSTWIKLAKDAYSRSTTYFENNYRQRWQNDIRMFQSKHPSNSKYNADSYKFRSRLFRPKTRSVVRKNEAVAWQAFFSNPDVLSIDPENGDDIKQVIGAEVMHHVLNYRLTKTIPWQITVVGAFQDAMTVGLACSLQTWRYRQKMEKQKVPATDQMTGEQIEVEMDVAKVLEDRPSVDLFPIENVRFDPAAHWYDVVGTSPYLILQIPMYVNDVLDNMETEDKQGNKWKKLDKKTILAARVDSDNSMRNARNENNEDPQTLSSEFNEFDVVMTHLNFIRKGDTTYVYYTLKDTHELSTPMPVEEMFLHCKDGVPPVVIGFCVLETHKPVPTSLVGLGKDLQAEGNEIVNQRLDNVKYVLNKRSIVKRGANVDIDSLLRNIPGGVTMANNVETDIREVNWQDVTSSSYQEQDRVNNDFDELMGIFAQSSVQTNRKLNETVGGMKIMAQGANALTEYGLQLFGTTWMQKVLRQLIKLEAAYETDTVILALAAAKAQLMPKYGISTVTDDLLNQELTLTVNVGSGSTDPDARLQRFTHATQIYTAVAQSGQADINLPEYRKEIFGLSGFPNAIKFFNTKVDPMVEHLKQVAQQAEQKAKESVDQKQFQLLSKERQLDNREHQIEVKAIEEKLTMGAEAQKAQAETMLRVREVNTSMHLEKVESAQEMVLKEAAARQEMRIREEEAKQEMLLEEQKAHNKMMLERQAAHNKAMLDKVSAPRKKVAKKVNGAWEVTESVQ